MNQFALEQRAVRYAQSLAQSTRRKTALLVGINDYAVPGTARLYGAVTDVELQRQLLIHRFGFLPTDIHILTNEQATRQNILAAYEEYLIQFVKPGDVAIFHFSGHGGEVDEIDQCDEHDGLCKNSTIVPYDSNATTTAGTVQDIMGHTRFLLDMNVPTDNLTVILDCCHSGGGKRGNVVIRSRNTASQNQNARLPRISVDEWDYQDRWLSRLNWTRDQFIQKRQEPIQKGVVITSAGEQELAADYRFEGFYAGAFTYLLTQHLWQQVAPQAISQVIRYTTRGTAHLSREHSQTPEYEPSAGKAIDIDPAFGLQHQSPPGEAVVIETLADDHVKLWLGGLDIPSLIAFDQGAVFLLLDREGNVKGEVIQDSERKALTTTGRVQRQGDVPPAIGDVLQEKVRQIPQHIPFKLGIMPELITAIEPFQTRLQQQLPFLEFVTVQSGAAVQAILGRENGRVGLFNALLEPLEHTFRAPTEPLERSLTQLQLPLQRLHLARLLHLLLNPNTTHLNVTATLNTSRRGSVIAIAPRSRGGDATFRPIPIEAGVKPLPLGTTLQISLRNDEPQDLYLSMLVIDAHGAVSLLFPYQWETPLAQSTIRANSTLALPEDLTAVEPYGLTELLIITSVQPLRQTLKVMKRSYRNEPIAAPTEVVTALFGDLNEGLNQPDTSKSHQKTVQQISDTASRLDTQRLATLSLLFDVVAASNSERDS